MGSANLCFPKVGGQNQLMESLTWPGLLAECGLTSGSDKGPSEAELIRRLEEKKKKNNPPPHPDQFHVQWPEDAGQTEQLDVGLFPSE